MISDGGNGHAVLFSRAPNSTTILNGVNTYTGDTLFYANTSDVTLKMGIANAIDSGSRVRAGTGSAGGNEYFDLNGFNQNIRALVDDQNANLIVTNNSSTDAVLTLSESNAANSAGFNGWIQDGATNKVSLVKTGAGTQILSGTNTYTGDTTVSAGTLVIDGNISTSTTTVNGTGILSGSGTVGALTIAAGGTHNPGNSPGIMNTGDYTMAGTLNIDAIGNTPGVGGYDQVNVTGTVTLGGTLATNFTAGTYANGNLLFILLNDDADPISGIFSSLPQNAFVINYGGFDWNISYTADSTGNTFTGGNDVALMAIPEPSVAALLGGLGVIALLRRRRRA